MRTSNSILKALGLMLLLLLWAAPAAAQDVYVRYRLPAGQRVQLSTPKVTLQAFSFDEYKVLLQMDSDLRKYEAQSPSLEEKIGDLNAQVEKLEGIIKVDVRDLKLAKGEIDRKSELVKDLAANNAKLEKELSFRKRLFRIAVGSGTALVGGLILGLFLGG